MPLHPATQQLIGKVEELSGRLVHVTEDPELGVMATIRTARGIAPAHFQLIDPSVDIGFDLSAEYAAACRVHGQ